MAREAMSIKKRPLCINIRHDSIRLPTIWRSVLQDIKRRSASDEPNGNQGITLMISTRPASLPQLNNTNGNERHTTYFESSGYGGQNYTQPHTNAIHANKHVLNVENFKILSVDIGIKVKSPRQKRMRFR